MNDRELLEMAAKAAGIEILRARLENPICADMLLVERTDDGHAIGWNPLTDDGDALRLAVKLRIHLEFAGRTSGNADRVQASPRGNGHRAWIEMFEGDDAAATRRAIVRAAAEIGRAES